MKKNLILAVLILTILPLGALTWLEGDFCINPDFAYFMEEGEEIPLPPPAEWYLTTSQKNLYRTLLEDVRYLYSFMIYGARFTYIPGDTVDGVKDQFEMELIGEIQWGDPNLSVTDLWFEGNLLYIHTRYKLQESQANRLEALKSTSYPVCGGWGEYSSLREGGRREAVKMAVRQSIRNYWQPREYNRPREFSGQVYLREFPHFGIKQGLYRASIMARFRFDTPLTYP